MDNETVVSKEQLELFKKLLKEEEEKYIKITKEEYTPYQKSATSLPKDIWIKRKDDIILGNVIGRLSDAIHFLRQDLRSAFQNKLYPNLKDQSFESYYAYALKGRGPNIGGRHPELDLIKSFYPTGQELEMKEFISTDYTMEDEQEKIYIAMLDKLIGQGKYKYITRKEIRDAYKKMNSPDLTLEEFIEVIKTLNEASITSSGVRYYNMINYEYEYNKIKHSNQIDEQGEKKSR